MASEVRNLAAQSAKSSKEITDTIAQVQTSVSETVDAMTNVYDNAVAQKHKADSVGRCFIKLLMQHMQPMRLQEILKMKLHIKEK